MPVKEKPATLSPVSAPRHLFLRLRASASGNKEEKEATSGTTTPSPLPQQVQFSHKPHNHAPSYPPTITTPKHASEMSNTFTPKSRRTRFALHLHIHDLNNVPLVSGSSYIKWHLPHSTSADHRGRTTKCPIRDHRVDYSYRKEVGVRLTVGKEGMLQECGVVFEVWQEYSAGGRGERIRLGEVRLNLAEFVDASSSGASGGGGGEGPGSPGSPGGGGSVGGAGAGGGSGGEEGVVRRYLMQDSKINSTLKVGIHMRHVEGTRDYYAPALRTAPVFGGIAGIISSSEPAGSAAHNIANMANGDSDAATDGASNVPSNLTSTNKETGEMQDMYRRTLAASWASQPGELKADDAIEDIFAGGDGWGEVGQPDVEERKGEMQQRRHFYDAYASHSHSQSQSQSQSRPGSGTSTPNPEAEVQARPKSSRSNKGMVGMGVGRHKKSKSGGGGGGGQRLRKGLGEVDEFDVRDDLRSWRVGERAYG